MFLKPWVKCLLNLKDDLNILVVVLTAKLPESRIGLNKAVHEHDIL